MAGYVKHFESAEYKYGDFKLAPEATDGIKQGGFVTIDQSEKEFDVPADDAAGVVFFVANEVDWLVPHNQDDSLFVVKAGDFVKAKQVVDGEVYVTDMVGSTYASISVGNELGVGADGKLYLIADLTAADFTGFKTTFLVIEKVKLNMRDAIVVAANCK